MKRSKKKNIPIKPRELKHQIEQQRLGNSEASQVTQMQIRAATNPSTNPSKPRRTKKIQIRIPLRTTRAGEPEQSKSEAHEPNPPPSDAARLGSGPELVRRYAPPAAAEERRCFPAAVLGVALKPCPRSGFALILGPTPFLTPLLAI